MWPQHIMHIKHTTHAVLCTHLHPYLLRRSNSDCSLTLSYTCPYFIKIWDIICLNFDNDFDATLDVRKLVFEFPILLLNFPILRLDIPIFYWTFLFIRNCIHKHVLLMNIPILPLTLNVPITTKVVCYSRLLKCLRSLYGYSVDPEQTAPIGAVCSGSKLLASILNLSAVLGNYLQQTTSADDIFRCIFSWRFKGYTFICLRPSFQYSHLTFLYIF